MIGDSRWIDMEVLLLILEIRYLETHRRPIYLAVLPQRHLHYVKTNNFDQAGWMCSASCQRVDWITCLHLYSLPKNTFLWVSDAENVQNSMMTVQPRLVMQLAGKPTDSTSALMKRNIATGSDLLSIWPHVAMGTVLFYSTAVTVV